MYLRNKKTYQAMQGAFESYLSEIDKPLKFKERDSLLARIFFDLTPNEIHQFLSRGLIIALKWEEVSSGCISIWPRLQSEMKALGLQETQLRQLCARVLSSVFPELELSVNSAVFQTLLSMQILTFESDELCFSASSRTRVLKVERFSSSREAYVKPLFNDSYYVPSSANKPFDLFDEKTYKIVREAYDIAVGNAQRCAVLSAEEVALLKSELSSIRNSHRLLLIFQTEDEIITFLVNEIVKEVEGSITYRTIPEYCDDSISHWYETIDIRTDYRWYSALNAMGVEAPDVFSFSDYQKHLAGKNNMYCEEKGALEFASLFSANLASIGRCNELDIDESFNTSFSCNGERLISFPEAIEQAYKKTCYDVREQLVKELKLLTKKCHSHQIFDLIPIIKYTNVEMF